MVDDELRELLTDYKSMAESERSNFASQVVKNSSFANLVFNSLLAFEDRAKNTEILPPLCDLLYNIYRRDTEGKIFAIQFLPQLAFIYLLNYGDKEQFGCIETFLIGVHNIEAKDTACFRIPNLSQNSIYHEAYQISESRIFMTPPDSNTERSNLTTVKKVPPPQVQLLNSQNKLSVVAFLLNVYCCHLVDMSRHSVEFSCKLASRMLTRGFNIGNRKSHRRNVSHGSDPGAKTSRILPNRLVLNSALLLELLQLAFFALSNNQFSSTQNSGITSGGLTLIRDIEFRAKHASMDSVLLVSKALLKMAPQSGAYMEDNQQRYISTPSQLSKNLITNASFRAKKLEGDIPRVETGEDGAAGVVGGVGVGGVAGAQTLIDHTKMGVIAEEEDIQLYPGEGGKKSKEDGNIADKIKARMENVRIPNMRKKLDRNSETDNGSHHKEEKSNKGNEKKEKKKEKNKENKTSATSISIQESSEPSDEFIKLQNLVDSETIAIHSPESGTTTFH